MRKRLSIVVLTVVILNTVINVGSFFDEDYQKSFFNLNLEEDDQKEVDKTESSNSDTMVGVTVMILGEMDSVDSTSLVPAEEEIVLEEIETDVLPEIFTDLEEIVTDIDYKSVDPYKMYVEDTFLNVRSQPRTTTEETILGVMGPGDKVVVIGKRDDGWFAVDYKEQTGFVASEFLTDKKPVEEKPAVATYNSNWSGAKLNPVSGHVNGPSGKETYYNLNMSRVVENMRNKGYSGEVWVREDGCKMFGSYVMCAANLSVHPRGSIVMSSLGPCIVVDTGDFAKSNPNQLDIATTW